MSGRLPENTRTVPSQRVSRSVEPPLKPHRSILEAEIVQAEEELQRPAQGLLVSGLLAGIGIGTSLFLMAVVLSETTLALPDPLVTLLVANGFTVGFADEYGRTPAQLLLRWALQKGVVPLPKANQTHHLEQNLGAFEFQIGEADMDRLDTFNEHSSSLGSSLQYI